MGAIRSRGLGAVLPIPTGPAALMPRLRRAENSGIPGLFLFPQGARGVVNNFHFVFAKLLQQRAALEGCLHSRVPHSPFQQLHSVPSWCRFAFRPGAGAAGAILISVRESHLAALALVLNFHVNIAALYPGTARVWRWDGEFLTGSSISDLTGGTRRRRKFWSNAFALGNLQGN